MVSHLEAWLLGPVPERDVSLDNEAVMHLPRLAEVVEAPGRGRRRTRARGIQEGRDGERARRHNLAGLKDPQVALNFHGL